MGWLWITGGGFWFVVDLLLGGYGFHYGSGGGGGGGLFLAQAFAIGDNRDSIVASEARGPNDAAVVATVDHQAYKEGISALLNKAARNGDITSVAACSHGPKISHLFFADDNIIFCQATSEECTRLENILETYEHASRQKFNKEKTSLFFSHNTSQDIWDNIRHRFGAEVIKQHETYLGLPSLVGRSKKNTFQALKERLDHKLSGWKEKLLS
ncbi:hypothetical protein SO802_004745 [Lithocarpus litseifolius]|uniref:Reverse transcriptase domain-containing protein n=1 Tax=Lithocarpus litseifolius TaxID=425828 RepID=A0AAW2E9K4_9ROSI